MEPRTGITYASRAQLLLAMGVTLGVACAIQVLDLRVGGAEGSAGEGLIFERIDQVHRACIGLQEQLELCRERVLLFDQSARTPAVGGSEKGGARLLEERRSGIATSIREPTRLPGFSVHRLGSVERRPPDWVALRALHRAKREDLREAQRAIALLTVPEVVERFGFPTYVVGGSRLQLVYKRSQVGQPDEEVLFYVMSGYVARFSTRFQN